ncbi:MAG: cytochrome c-type biogenesis protein CcmH [Gemmatimonadaceae bacterium]
MSKIVTVTRRSFLLSVAGAVGATVSATVLHAQEESRASTGAPMDDDAYRPVTLPPKANATPLVTNAQRDDLEHKMQCRCSCTLDVYTCRTTDFTCPVSPRMHADVMGLIAGGYNADEILSAFQRVFGERVLMSPVKQGFNWVGYLLPFTAIGAGSVGLLALLKHWSRPESQPVHSASGLDVSTDEMARLREAMRNDE